MSQKIRATWVSDRHGMIWKVEGSGRATMSASWIRANPSMAEPSNPMPSASALGSSWVVMAIDFRNPSTSVNHSRINLIPRSSTVRSTYSASFDRLMRIRPSSLGEESVKRAEPETVTGVLNQLGQDSGHRPGEDQPHRVGLEPAKDDEAATARSAVNGSTMTALPSCAVTAAMRPRADAVAPRRKTLADGEFWIRGSQRYTSATNPNEGRKIAAVATRAPRKPPTT